MKTIWISSALLVFAGALNAQDLSQPVQYLEFVKTIDPSGKILCTQVERNKESVEREEQGVARSGLHILKETIGRKGAHGVAKPAVPGLDIILRGTAQLDSNPTAKQAFVTAAARWEGLIQSPVTIVIDVDYGATRWGEAWPTNVIGTTFSAVYTATTVRGGGGSLATNRQFADSLKSRNPAYGTFYDFIPDTIPNTTGNRPTVAGTLPNLQATGYRDPIISTSIAYNSTPRIAFNSAVNWDFDFTNGINSNQIDFDGTCTHEMGHALGFVSYIGGSGSYVYPWDIFRFRPGAVTDFLTFKSTARVTTPGPNATGGDHVFWDGERELELSTATGSRTGGDGQQASHWRNDALRTNFPVNERYIGIMDPETSNGKRDSVTLADKKALSIFGWKIDFNNYIDSVVAFSAKSNYQTPNTVSFSWKNPARFYDWTPLADWKIVVQRDGQQVKEFVSPAAGAAFAFTDSGLVQYKSYTYSVYPVYVPTNASGKKVSKSIYSGGSPIPGTGYVQTSKSNNSTVLFTVVTPTTHDDQTVLHNLGKMKIYRNNLSIENLIDSITVSAADTGKTFYFVDTPPSRFLSAYAYYVKYVGIAPGNPESEALVMPTVTGGKILTAAYVEDFEAGTQSVVTLKNWDSISVVAHSPSHSFGILSYPNNANTAAYIPQVKGNGTPTLSFWTICRTEADKDLGLVEVSRNRGKIWAVVQSLSAKTHPEWEAGTNTWFRHSITLTDYATDTILVRFRFVSDSATSGYGWLLDDIMMSPVLTSVEQNHQKLPAVFQLGQNYPNPFNPTTAIEYAVTEPSFVTLTVYDALGREIESPVHSLHQPGWYAIRYDASQLGTGVYYYRLTAGSFTSTKKMMVIK